MRTICRSIGHPQLKGRRFLQMAGKGVSRHAGDVGARRLLTRVLEIPLKRGFLDGWEVCKYVRFMFMIYMWSTLVFFYVSFFLFFSKYRYVANKLLNDLGGVGLAEEKIENKGKGLGVLKMK